MIAKFERLRLKNWGSSIGLGLSEFDFCLVGLASDSPPTFKFSGVCLSMKKSVFVVVASVLVIGFGFSNAVQAQKWADLTMTVLLDGDLPKPKVVQVNADAICMQNKVMSEDLVVDPTTKAIANIVFMIDSKKTKLEANQLHPDLQKVPSDKPAMDNLKCAFVPHIMTMRAGQTLLVKNSDQTGHNAKFNFFKNEEVNPMIPVGGSKEIVTTLEEPTPTKVECSIHPWMSGYVIVAGHPYVGISDAVGKIKIEKLPAGIELDFKLWHESQDKSIEEVSLSGKKEKWTKGSVKLTLKEGINDLGKLLIKPDRFKAK